SVRPHRHRENSSAAARRCGSPHRASPCPWPAAGVPAHPSRQGSTRSLLIGKSPSKRPKLGAPSTPPCLVQGGIDSRLRRSGSSSSFPDRTASLFLLPIENRVGMDGWLFSTHREFILASQVMFRLQRTRHETLMPGGLALWAIPRAFPPCFHEEVARIQTV